MESHPENNRPLDSETTDGDGAIEHAIAPPDDHGISLEDLGQAYAELMGGGDPYQADPRAAPDEEVEHEEEGDSFETSAAGDDACELSPRTILEAMLFVGHPGNEPLTSNQVAALMRGVRPAEIDELVQELNAQYAAERAPYQVVSVGAGYRMAIREEFQPLREKFYGRIKEARLSQSTIDVLAIVAYHQPVNRAEVEETLAKSCGGILSQLVRRGLLGVERRENNPKEKLYRTTDRFLHVFGLETLNDLPQSQELDRFV